MKVSIVIPFYNVEKYIGKCIESVLNQKVSKDITYDIYLIDDKGSDGSREIVESYQKSFPDVIHLLTNEENMGQGRSRMKAVYMTDADYVMFVDSDDYIASDYIERFVSENDGDYDLIIAGYTKDIDGKLKRFSISNSPYTILLYPVACCKMFKLDYLKRNNIDFSDSRKGEDIYFSLATFYCKPKYKIIDYYGYYYRLNRTSTTRSMNYNNDFEEIVINMFDKFRDHYDVTKINKKMRQAVEYAYVANIVNALVVYGHGSGMKRMKKKLERVEEDISKNYPELLNNPLLRFFKPWSVSLKIRCGVGAYYWSRKFKMTNIMFLLVAMM